MRDIKFRGQTGTTEGKKWVYGHYYKVKSFFNDKVGHFIGMIRGNHLNDFSIDENTLGQYTGLKDKNGKEIYEGDICLYIGSDGIGDISHPYCGERRSFVGEKIVIDRYESMVIGRHISTYKKSIEFSAPNGIINGWEIIRPYDIWNHQGWLEVIGNIYDNPELLEAEE